VVSSLSPEALRESTERCDGVRGDAEDEVRSLEFGIKDRSRGMVVCSLS
jgi:hypothetical protein